MINEKVGLGRLGLGFLFLLGACGSGADSHGKKDGESAAEQVQPLVQTIETPVGVGAITTFAGKGPPNAPGNVDIDDATLGKLNDPAGLAWGQGGPPYFHPTTYVADWGNNAVRTIWGAWNYPTKMLDTLVRGRPNLLANPRAEDVSAPTGVTGWSVLLGPWQALARGSQCSNTVCGHPYDGTFWFWGGAVPDALMSQEVIIGTDPNISSGTARYHFSALVRGNTDEQARIFLRYATVENAGGPLYDSGYISPSTWTPVEGDFVVPVGAHSIRVYLQTHALSGGSADVYFDALQLRKLRPTGAPSSDEDREILGPAAVGVLGDGTGSLLVGGEGLWTVTQGTQSNPTITTTKLTGSNGYSVPRRVSAISVVGTTNRAYIADPTDPLLHVRSNSGKGYRVDVTGLANEEPLAVAARPFDSTNDLLWVSFRGYQKVYLFKCPVPAGTADTTTVTTCIYLNSALGSSSGFVDDMDGTVGGERFRQGIYGLANGLNGDLLIAEDYNSAVRRNAGAYTFTIGGGTRGYLDGSRTNAQFWGPASILQVPGTGDVLVADRNNNVIRKIRCGGSPICGGSVGGCPSFPIDDQVPCTSDYCESLAIRHTPVAMGFLCSDSNNCNGFETCSASGVCQPGTSPTLDDNKACSADGCDPAFGVTHTAMAAGTPCAIANDACRAPSACNGASLDCPVGALLPTDDDNDCTVDACSAMAGITHTPRPSSTPCRTNVTLSSNDGMCNGAGACIGTNVGAPVAVDRTLPTPPGTLFDDVLASSGNGGLQGAGSATACVNTSATPTCVFIPSHMAIVRGTVADASGAGIGGATISVVNHPEFGTTTTFGNGEYILLVNGGGALTIRASKSGKLPSDRLVDPPWGGTDFAADIVLLGLDPAVTAVNFVAGAFASGTPTPANAGGDTSKARTAAVYFPPNTAVSAGASSITNARFRVTEYTVGNDGVGRMPADVAANTMYTYAAEFSLEDAAGNVYDHVTFGAPVMSYVDNFIDLEVGEAVPVGYYDREAGLWKPMRDGRVIAVDNAGTVTGIQPGDVPISTTELATLAAYSGKSIWRLPLEHFSPLDFNLGVGAPPCETQGGNTVCPQPVSSPLKGSDDGPDCGSCTKTGSIIDVERQVLREKFPVVGTPFHLAYSSENTLGYGWNKTLSVNIEDHPKHSLLEGYTISFVAAGRLVALGGLSKLPDGSWPKSYEKTWDGLDYEGRPVQGAAIASLDVGAVYPAVPSRVTTFGGSRRSGGNTSVSAGLTGYRDNPKLTIWTKYTKNLQVWDSSALGFGGWSLSTHHTYDPAGNVIYQGDGTHRKVESIGAGTVSLVAGTGLAGTSPNGTVPANAAFNSIEGMAVDRDGNVYVALPDDHVIRKISNVNGNYTTVNDYAGSTANWYPPSNAADAPSGAPAQSPVLYQPYAIALHDDGRLVVADHGQRRAFEVSGGVIRTIAGRAPDGFPPPAGCGLFVDGVSAKQFDLCAPWGVAAGPDGSTYVLDHRPNSSGGGAYVARIDQVGRVWLVSGIVGGSSSETYYKDLLPNTHATQMAVKQSALTVDRNNTIWLAAAWDLVSIPQSGFVRAFPMARRGQTYTYSMDVAAFPNGDILRPSKFVADDGMALERCTPAGVCSRIAGSLTRANASLGAAALGTTFNRIDAVATGPDGSFYIADAVWTGSSGWRVYRVAPALAPATTAEACIHKVPAQDRSEYYCFDKNGQHRSTINATTNGTLRTFEYFTSGASTGLLKKVIEADGRFTEIDRSVSGSVTIKSPTLQTTTITLEPTKQLYASSISGDGTITPTHDVNNGLLRSLVDADSQTHTFNYDNYGRLQRDADPVGYQVLSRTDTASGYTVAVTTRMGKRDTFTRDITSDGSERRTFGLLNGLSNVTERDLGGNTTSTAADGLLFKTSLGADPVWGLLTPFTSKSTTSVPAAALNQTVSTTRALQVDGVSFTDTATVVGQTTRSYTRAYNHTNKTLELTSPFNRKTKYTLDTQGRVTSVEYPGVQKIDFTISATTGRLDGVTQGTRVVNLTYSPSGANKGFLTEAEDPHLTGDANILKTVFGPDGNGRPLTSKRKNVTTLADVTTAFQWTPGGSLKSVTPPDKPIHQLGYDAAGFFKTYTPPTLGGTDEVTTFNLDLDHYLQGVNAPGWDDLALDTDPVKGRLRGLTVNGQRIVVEYFPAATDPSCTAGCAPGRVRQVTDYRGGITTTYQWYNALPKSVSDTLPSSGSDSATVAWTYDNDIRVKDETVSVGTTHTSKTTFGFDLDGLLTCASLGTCATGQAERVELLREATSGRINSVTAGSSPAESLTYNAFGELRSLVSTPISLQYEDVTGTPNVLRDPHGRVKRRIERIPAAAPPSTFNYTYDEHNRLWKVQEGSNTREYRYDDNGNRTFVNTPGDSLGGTPGDIVYNNQDQLLKYGNTTFDYTPKGDLWHRYAGAATTTYDYDALGALRSVRQPNGSVIEYVVDGRGRRVGKKLNGVLVQQWVYGQQLGPVAELDGTGAVKMRFVYGSRANVPDLVKTYPDGKVYRLYVDQLGSPRILYDIAAGTSKWIGWDEFGIRQGSPSGVEVPFGFAGGLYDPDTQLTRFGARDYDASIGRWVSKDPILFGGRQTNFYAYAGNDPVNFVDPSGLVVNFLVGAAVGGGTNLLWQLVQNGGDLDCVRLGEVAIAAGVGALTGGLSAGAGLMANVGIGALGNVVQYGLTNAAYGKMVTGDGAWNAAVWGALGGGVAFKLAPGPSSGVLFKETSRFLDRGAAEVANSAATSAATAFIRESSAQIAGGMVGSVPGPE